MEKGISNYWTCPRNDGKWSVKKEGSSRATSVHKTQAEAWKETRRRARGAGTEALLQNQKGRIRARNSYGTDPNPPKD